MDDARERLAGLYDCYGALLTEKQRLYFEERYLDDLSLSEIAENEGISKQGVRDLLVRAERTLQGFEEKLGFAARLRDAGRDLSALKGLLKDGDLEAALAVIDDLKERF